MRGKRWAISATTIVAAIVLVAGPAPAEDGTWTRVGVGITEGISGLAPAGTGWVIARDNKVAGQNRVALLDGAGRVTPLTWPGEAPADLESLALVPDGSGSYAALTSTGRGSLFTLAAGSVSVQRSFTVPRGAANIEAFALTPIGSSVVAVWAIRGSSTAPATVFAATFVPGTGVFGKVVSGKVTVPYPTTKARPVSDLAIVGFRLVASSTSDPGNAGPFDSALYDVGSVGLTAGRATLSLKPPVSLGTYAGHKIEGIACAAGTGLLGTDDEKQGGWVRAATFCS